MKNLLTKKVALAVVSVLIVIFAALPYATGLKYACIAESLLGGAESAACTDSVE